MEIENVPVGPQADPYFVAEAGVNHNGSISMAEELVDAAVAAGSDAVKFQSFSADRLVAQDTPKAEYQERGGDDDSQYEMLQRYELTRDDHEYLFDYCESAGITFLSTPFDINSADMLADLGVSAIKLGSGELDNYPLLRYVAELGLPMLVSTGMATMEKIHAARTVIRDAASDAEMVFLHCTSAYPCDVADVNLRAMQTMDTELDDPIGYSDHTVEPETPGLAVAAGACVVEKHFTLNSSLPGPDHATSLEPDELDRSVRFVETATRALGAPDKKPTESEQDAMQTARKSLHAAVPIEPGEPIEEQHLDVLRPPNGLSPRHYEAVLGNTAASSLNPGDPIQASDVYLDVNRE